MLPGVREVLQLYFAVMLLRQAAGALLHHGIRCVLRPLTRGAADKRSR